VVLRGGVEEVKKSVCGGRKFLVDGDSPSRGFGWCAGASDAGVRRSLAGELSR
jgi:hypothetical protein